jgi:hypothetical protein
MADFEVHQKIHQEEQGHSPRFIIKYPLKILNGDIMEKMNGYPSPITHQEGLMT